MRYSYKEMKKVLEVGDKVKLKSDKRVGIIAEVYGNKKTYNVRTKEGELITFQYRDNLIVVPSCKLVGQDSCRYNLMKLVSNCMRENGMEEFIHEFYDECFEVDDFKDILNVFEKYVIIE